MIASYSEGFIFIKTKKTASTSVEIVLSGWCSGRDVCTRLTAEDEIIRRDYGCGPRNFCRDPELEQLHLETISGGEVDEIARSNRMLRNHMRFRPHQSAMAVREELPDLWAKAFRFTISRHPYEVAVSQAFWKLSRRHGGDAAKWEEVLESIVETGAYANHELYMEEGQLLVDEVLAFERLWSELGQIAERLGKPFPDSPPRAKTSHRVDRRPAAEILTQSQKSRIAERCRVEFELMGYQR